MEQTAAYIVLEPKAKRRVLWGIMLMFMYNILYSFSIPVAFPAIMRQYGAMGFYAILAGIVAMVGCIVVPIGGKLGDRFGRRRVCMIAMAARLALALLCAVPTNAVLFMAAYTGIGAAAGLLSAYSHAMVSDVTTLEERPRWVGLMGSLNGLCLLVGMLGGGVVADLLGPLSVFAVFVPVGLGAVALLAVYYPNRPAQGNSRLDMVGMGLMSAGLVCILTWCIFGGSLFPRVSAAGIALLAAGAVLLAVFAGYERRAASPIVQFRFFHNRNFVMSFLACALIAPMVQVCSSALTLFGQVSLGLSVTMSGTLALPKNLLMLILPALISRWMARDRRRFRTVFLLCGGSIALGGAFAATWNSATPVFLIYVGMLAFGVGTSCQVVSIQPYTQLALPPEDIGSAAAMIQFSNGLSGMVYSVFYNILYNARYERAMAAGGGEHLAQAVTEVYSAMALLSGVCGLLIVAAALIFTPGRRRTRLEAR